MSVKEFIKNVIIHIVILYLRTLIFIMRDRNGADPDERGGRKGLGESREKGNNQDTLWEKRHCFQ